MQLDNLNFMQKYSLFRGMPNNKIMDILYECKTIKFNKNNIVYDIGDPVECIYFVREGEIELLKFISLDDSN